MQLPDFQDKKILVMGLGLHGGGVGAVKFFSKLGSRVTVTDIKSKKELAPSLKALRRFPNVVYRLGRHEIRDFRTSDYIIKNPGVADSSKFLDAAARAGVPILSDVEIFFKICPAPIIGVTGTKGKSTATWLIGEFLHRSGKRVWVGGNIRKSVLEFLPEVRKSDLVVLELSSFQLDSLGRSRMSPHIAVITNIFADHLNRYANMRSYIASKCGIFRFQKRGDHLLINAKDKLLRRLVKKAPSRIEFFDAEKDLRPFGKFIKPSIPRYHFPSIAAAAAVARRAGVGDSVIKKVLAGFSGIPGRMELVRTVRGVEFINDTTATNPTASEEAVYAVKKRIGKHGLHIIAGGPTKKLDPTAFIRRIARLADSVVFLPGEASKVMQKILRKFKPRYLAVAEAKTMTEAVRLVFKSARRGDAVLLSPGAASFGLFRHEFERGEAFRRAVRGLTVRHKRQR